MIMNVVLHCFLNSLDSQLLIYTLLSRAQLSAHCLLSFTARSLWSFWYLDTHTIFFDFSTLTAKIRHSYIHMHTNASIPLVF